MPQADFARGWPVGPPHGSPVLCEGALATREEPLARAPLFSGLPKRHLRSIAKVTTVSHHQDGAILVEEGALGSTFFVVLEGRGKVVRNGRMLSRLGPGDFFGEIALLDPGPRAATVVAEAPMRCLELGSKVFLDVVSQEPLLATRILRALAKRLREAGRPQFE